MQGYYSEAFLFLSTEAKLSQGLVTNGAKVYLVAHPNDQADIQERVTELCDLGTTSGGSAIG